MISPGLQLYNDEDYIKAYLFVEKTI